MARILSSPTTTLHPTLFRKGSAWAGPMLSAGIETILETIHIGDAPGIRQGRTQGIPAKMLGDTQGKPIM